MKSVPLVIILAISILSSCASLPELNPVFSVDTTLCSRPFATEQQQFVYHIFVTLPDGKNSLITGITTISPPKMSAHVVIMTLEGLVVFEGRIDHKKISIQRSISFFSSVAFAEGLLNDVRLVFLKPAGILVETGKSADGMRVCRYRNLDKSILDVLIEDSGDWKLVQYGADFHPIRRVSARYTKTHLLSEKKIAPDRIELVASGSYGYILDMQRIQ